MKPRLLDLFSGAGGAARGYQMAGFYVVGVDVKPQPRYAGDEFIQADAMTFPLEGFDAIHASPPCQAFSAMKSMPSAKQHPDLLAPTRERLRDWGRPYVIENVEGAPMFNFITLCGTAFGLGVKGADNAGGRSARDGTQQFSTEERREAMGIDWMTGAELSQAIPPAYCEFIGKHLMAALHA